MRFDKYIVVDPESGPVDGTEAPTREQAWRKFVSSPYAKAVNFADAVNECLRDGFKVVLREFARR